MLGLPPKKPVGRGRDGKLTRRRGTRRDCNNDGSRSGPRCMYDEGRGKVEALLRRPGSRSGNFRTPRQTSTAKADTGTSTSRSEMSARSLQRPPADNQITR
jgi:hypothetical protein